MDTNHILGTIGKTESPLKKQLLMVALITRLLEEAGKPAPMIIAFILTPVLEVNFRQAMIISNGSFSIFYAKPISLACLVITGILYLLAAVPRFKAKRPKLGIEE